MCQSDWFYSLKAESVSVFKLLEEDNFEWWSRLAEDQKKDLKKITVDNYSEGDDRVAVVVVVAVEKRPRFPGGMDEPIQLPSRG